MRLEAKAIELSDQSYQSHLIKLKSPWFGTSYSNGIKHLYMQTNCTVFKGKYVYFLGFFGLLNPTPASELKQLGLVVKSRSLECS